MDFDQLFVDEREKGDTLLKKCQLVMLRMLKIVDALCAKHEVDYFLVGGSLLGAVRHKGFIPWDDDLDIGMTRENYIKFIQYAVPELPKDIFFQNTDTDPYYPACDFVEARLRDKYSRYDHKGGENNKWHEGLQIDIFVYDRAFLPHNFFIITQNYFLRFLKNNQKRARILNWIGRLPSTRLVYASNYLQSFGLLNLGANFIKEQEISDLTKIEFEDIKVPIPIGWDKCLERQFGDYKKLPPVEKRISHHNVLPDPFTPCDHSEILHWKN